MAAVARQPLITPHQRHSGPGSRGMGPGVMRARLNRNIFKVPREKEKQCFLLHVGSGAEGSSEPLNQLFSMAKKWQ